MSFNWPTSLNLRRRLRVNPSYFLLPLLALPAPELAAQDRSADAELEERGFLTQGSTYLTLEQWAYDYIDILIARGRLTDLAPLVQPYRRLDVAIAIRNAEAAGRFIPGEDEMVESLRRELAPELELLGAKGPKGVQFGAEVGVGFQAVSQLHRDPLRPEGDADFFPVFELRLYGDAPAVAGALRLVWNNHYLNDPQFPNGRAIEFRQCDPVADVCAYRVEDAYVELQLPYVRLFFGRMDRNWGLPGNNGLQLSDYSYSYDHIGYKFGSERVALTGLFTPLSDFKGDTTRYFSSHRFDWMIRDNLSISVGESVLYGGENRAINFAFTNPIGVWEISGNPSGDTERNSLGLGEVWWRPFSNLVTYGSFVVDNTSVGDEDIGKASGFNQFAAALGAQLPALTPTLGLRFDFSVVNGLAYRSRVAFFEYFTLNSIGLARDKIDAVIVVATADWFARRGLVLKPGFELMWKGEDDLTDPFPDGAFTGRDNLLVGTVETTIRPVIDGRWHLSHPDLPWRGLSLDLAWDLGLNIVKNKDHQTAGWEVEGVGSVDLLFRQTF